MLVNMHGQQPSSNETLCKCKLPQKNIFASLVYSRQSREVLKKNSLSFSVCMYTEGRIYHIAFFFCLRTLSVQRSTYLDDYTLCLITMIRHGNRSIVHAVIMRPSIPDIYT